MGSGYLRSSAVIERLVSALAIVFFTLFAWKHVRYMLTATVQFDDAFIANVAKNLAEGHGYSASYYGFRPFHLEITTGPTVIFPAAALIRILGNQYWVPTLAYTLLVGALIVELLAMLKRRMPERAFATAAALIALGLFAFGAQEIGLLGEMPAALLTAIAALILTRDPSDWRATASGLLFGAAMLAKAVATLALPTFIFAMFTLPFFRGRRIRTAGEFLLAAALPVAAFELWKLAVIGSLSGWTTLVTNELLDVAGPNAPLSGSATVVAALSDPRVLAHNIARNSVPLLAWWGGTRNPVIAPIWFHGWLPALLATAGVVSTVVSAVMYGTRERSSPEVMGGMILIGAGVTSFAWWLALAPMGWPRHAQPGLIRTLIGCAIVIGAGVPRNARLPAVAAFLLVLSLAPNAFELRDPINPYSDLWDDIRTGPQATQRLRAVLATAGYLHAMEAEDPSIRLIGCGWSHNPALEYLMPGGDHFRDCILVRERALKGRRLILVRGEYFNQLHLPDIRRFQEWCEQNVLFRAMSWVVSECPGPPPEPPWRDGVASEKRHTSSQAFP